MKTYFWHKDRVVTLDKRVFAEDFSQCSMLKFLYCHCVQTDAETGRSWAGFFDQSERFQVSWLPYDIEKFDPEFRAYLLLLEIPSIT